MCRLQEKKWASWLEVYAASKVLDLAVAYSDGHNTMFFGDTQPKFMLYLAKSHYFLHKIHTKIKQKGAGQTYARAE